MKRAVILRFRGSCAMVVGLGAGLALGLQPAQAQNLLTNGNLDLVQKVEIVPGFFLPKPASWQNVGTRTIAGPYEDEMSSEPWAGPAPTPVTTDGTMNDPPHNFPDLAVFFKGFSGNSTDGAATGHLYQDVPGIAGATYTLTGWAGAEQNFMAGAEFALEFLDSSSVIIGGTTLDLVAAGLFVDNGEPFDYKQYTLTGTAPAGTAFVRARASMLNGMFNPMGGGQAYVVDDFVLVVPAPGAAALAMAGGLLALRRRR